MNLVASSDNPLTCGIATIVGGPSHDKRRAVTGHRAGHASVAYLRSLRRPKREQRSLGDEQHPEVRRRYHRPPARIPGDEERDVPALVKLLVTPHRR